MRGNVHVECWKWMLVDGLPSQLQPLIGGNVARLRRASTAGYDWCTDEDRRQTRTADTCVQYNTVHLASRPPTIDCMPTTDNWTSIAHEIIITIIIITVVSFVVECGNVATVALADQRPCPQTSDKFVFVWRKKHLGQIGRLLMLW